jgi:integrase
VLAPMRSDQEGEMAKAWVSKKPNGKFIVRYRDTDGRTKSLGTFDTREQAETRATHAPVFQNRDPFGWDAQEPKVSPGRVSDPVAGYLREWIERDRNLRPSTRRLYLQAIRNHLDGTPLGAMDVREVTDPREIRRYWDGLSSRDETSEVGPGTRDVVRKLLSKCFRQAYLDGMIPANTFERARIARPHLEARRTRGIVTGEDVEALAGAALCERDRLGILLMSYCGLRASEVGGLFVQDLDGPRCELHVTQQVRPPDTTPRYAPLKTRRSRRTVGLPPSLCEELREYVAGKVGPVPVFLSDQGLPWYDVMINRAVHQAAARAGLEGVHSHLLRHLAGSLAFEDGATAAEVAELLGEAIDTVLSTYVEAGQASRRKLADATERRRGNGR